MSCQHILSAGRRGECEQSTALPSCWYLLPVVVLPITIQSIKKKSALADWLDGWGECIFNLEKVNLSSGVTTSIVVENPAFHVGHFQSGRPEQCMLNALTTCWYFFSEQEWIINRQSKCQMLHFAHVECWAISGQEVVPENNFIFRAVSPVQRFQKYSSRHFQWC